MFRQIREVKVVLPIKDDVRTRSFPAVTIALITANILVFLIQISLSQATMERLVWNLGMVPSRFLSEPSPAEWLTLFTSQFLHGSWLHLLGNMIALYIFGDNIEDRFGRWQYLAFYLVSGVAASLVHLSFLPDSLVPAVGASGAISGVMGAYLVLFPTARIITLIPVFLIPWFVPIPAVVWIGGWALMQLFGGVYTLLVGTENIGGIAWWAHVGGLAAGLLLVWPLRQPAPAFHRDEYWPW